jgi:hypothetical protein
MFQPVHTHEELQQEWRNQFIQWYAAGAPAFTQPKLDPFKQLRVHFKTREDREHFADRFGYKLTDKTHILAYPNKEREVNLFNKWVDDETHTRYPIYILSKGRWESRYTAKALERMGIKYYICVEPQEFDKYQAVTNPEFGTVLELPFSNHGKGSGPARNWMWEHSLAMGFDKHWMMDDNIVDFGRLHNNKRYIIEKGSGMFRAVEDFTDRYENVALAGPHYKFFVINQCAYQPFILNTRLMSCILIDNRFPGRWRGKFNEDVDISIRALKEGWTTMLFYAFFQGKMRTGTVKGGNTTEVYKDYKTDASGEDPAYNKSKMLKEMHPDCVTLVERYGRVHHHVDLNAIVNKHTGQPARQNALILKKDVPIYNKTNNYGMSLMRNYGTDDQYADPKFEADVFPTGRTSIHA